MVRRALITGATGQDGWYLTELLAGLRYEVYAFVRRTSNPSTVHPATHAVVYGSMESYESLFDAVSEVKPDEIYHLAAQSFVHHSFLDPFSTFDINATGTLRLLQVVKRVCPGAKLYFAGTSEMFGNQPAPQSETTPFAARSPYGASKIAAYEHCRVFREAFGMFVCNGILFNHESPRRGREFVTRKIIDAARERKSVVLGNLDARRDWGHAKDYVHGMYLMMQKEEPDDYVLATGTSYSVADFAAAAYRAVGLDWRDMVNVHYSNMRPAEVNVLCGDASKARIELGWSCPNSGLANIIEDMLNGTS